MSFLDGLIYGIRSILNNGTSVPTRSALNFIGATIADDPTNDRTNVTVSGGGDGSIPTGTGFVHVSDGVEDPTAAAVNLSTTDVAGLLPLANALSMQVDTFASLRA